MKPLLSIILPSIRPYNLERLYDSILEATVNSFELIVVGPFSLPDALAKYPNIKVFRDWGSPTRASQIGACLAEGTFLTYAADDGVYLPNSIDQCLEVLKSMEMGKLNDGTNLPVCLSAKYLEGNEGSFSVTNQPDSLYKLKSCYPNTPLINDNWWILNVGFMRRELFEEFGGWNCEYEVCPIAHADLAARLQYNGIEIGMANIAVLKCEHMPGISGDHRPIHDGQVYADTPKYIENLSNTNYFLNESRIDMNNWKNADAIWERRFGINKTN